MNGWAGARRLLTAALIGATFLFLGREIYRSTDQLRSFDWQVRPWLLLLSVALLSLVFLWGVVVWKVLLQQFGTEVSLRALARAWFLANLSRYVPGVVWQFVSLAQLGPAAGLSPSAIVTSLLVQMGFLLLSAGLLGIYLLPTALAGELGPVLRMLRWAGPVVLLLVHPAVIRMALQSVGRITRREPLEWQGSWLDGLWILTLSSSAWVLNGIAFHLLLNAFIPLPASILPAITAINALAFIVGYAAFFAPGGIGFKEGALTLLLSGLVPSGVAASLAILARLWTMAAEIIPAFFLLRKVDSSPPVPQPPEP